MVSVIITCYGPPRLLEKAIRSVSNQTFTDWELIIVDDNEPSTLDRRLTDELLDKLIDEVPFKHIKHTSNLNGSVARNTGFKVSKGDYISFLDSDDEYDPSRLMTCVDSLKNVKEKYAGVYTGCIIKRNGKIYSRRFKAQSGNFLIDSLACVFEFYSGSNLFIRREVYEKLGGFDEFLLRHQDYDFLVRLFQSYSLVGVERLLLLKNNENRNLPNAEKVLGIKKYYLEKYSTLLQEISSDEASYVRYCHNIAISESFASEGNFHETWNYYLLSIQYKVEIIRFFRVFAKFFRYQFIG